MTDHYATLGVARTATQDEIKRAFRKLASQHHPDKGGDTAKFQEIQAAYDTLGDEAKRAEYNNPRPQFSGMPNGANFNMNDIFSGMFGQNFAQQQARRGHVRMSLWISLADVATGGQRTVTIGTQQGAQGVEIEIPRGINDGDNVQYQGLGPGGADLVVQYRVQPDPNWERQGLNLITNRKINVFDLILGVDIRVRDLLGNELSMTVPSGTQPGIMLRLKGRGLPDRQGQQGDAFVRISTELPVNIAPEIREAIQNYHK
jgi:DnaJ-class molecular chaperone